MLELYRLFFSSQAKYFLHIRFLLLFSLLNKCGHQPGLSNLRMRTHILWMEVNKNRRKTYFVCTGTSNNPIGRDFFSDFNTHYPFSSLSLLYDALVLPQETDIIMPKEDVGNCPIPTPLPASSSPVLFFFNSVINLFYKSISYNFS